MNIVSVRKLVKNYGDTIAVNKIDLDIQSGEIYGLLGPNGAGKTTLINMLCDMTKKDSGQLELFGQNIEKNMLKLKANIGVVPQNLAIYEDLTAYENVKFFGALYGLKKSILKEKTAQALEFVGLEKHANKKVKTFSGGMKRRLNIACAICHEPKLIIMDEPTVGIDPQSRNHILTSVKKLNEQGSTIIYTTHLMEEAEFLCSRIGIIDHGKLIAEGSLESLQNIVNDKKRIQIKLNYTEDFNFTKLRDIKGVVSILEDSQQLTIETLKESDCLLEILNTLEANNIKVIDIQMQGASLESTFLSLTGRSLRD